MQINCVAGTGHRPDKLGGYDEDVFRALVELARTAITRYEPLLVISGMAQGWDQALAQAAQDLRVPYAAAVPFANQDMVWPREARARYRALLAGASHVAMVSPGPFTPAKMQRRNEWMVDHCDALLALWDGSRGGTFNCLEYARVRRRQVINLWEEWTRRGQ